MMIIAKQLGQVIVMIMIVRITASIWPGGDGGDDDADNDDHGGDDDAHDDDEDDEDDDDDSRMESPF